MENNLTRTLAADFIHYTNQSIFLTGRAGTGKTTFLKELKASAQKEMIIAAPTGVAAVNAGGVTLHSLFQLPFKPFIPANRKSGEDYLNGMYENELLEGIHFSREKRALLMALELLVIDEISMVRADMMDAIDIILRQVRNRSGQPFGGVQLLLIGDLLQLSPIVKPEDWAILQQFYTSPFFFRSKTLTDYPLAIIELHHIYRQKDSDFIALLNNVRNNKMTQQDYALLDKCYKPSKSTTAPEGYITLTTHNNHADAINASMLESLSADAHTYNAVITGEFDPKQFPTEQTLVIKKGTQLMFLKNDRADNRRFFNGRICTVTRIDGEDIYVEIPDEKEMLLEKETWKNLEYRYDATEGKIKEIVTGEFRQYPVRLAWAITIHKSQGLTFEKAIIDAGSAFTAGQVYVALSRVRSLQGLELRSRITPESIDSNTEAIAYISKAIPDYTAFKLLEEEKRRYLLEKISGFFNWKKILLLLAEHKSNFSKWGYKETSADFHWEEELRITVELQQETVEKFSQQLGNIFDLTQPGLSKVQERIKAAATYFNNQLDWTFIPKFDANFSKAKQNKSHRGYLHSLSQINNSFSELKERLNNLLSLSSGWQEGIDYKTILSQLNSFNKSPIAKERPKKVTTPKKISSSSKTTFKLFLTGKSVVEIAKERKLATHIIEAHLLEFITTGELSVFDIMSKETINEILTCLNVTGHNINTAKGVLGTNHSYFNIRAVANHYLLNKDKVV